MFPFIASSAPPLFPQASAVEAQGRHHRSHQFRSFLFFRQSTLETSADVTITGLKESAHAYMQMHVHIGTAEFVSPTP